MSEIITNEEHLKKLFSVLSNHNKIPCIISGKKIYIGELNFSKENNQIFFSSKNFSFIIPNSKPIGFKFINKDIIYSFVSEIKNYDKGKKLYSLTNPNKISLSFKRMLSRYDVKENDLIYLSINGYSEEFKIKNITTKGLAFITNHKIFKKTNISKKAAITINNKKRLAINLVIKYISEKQIDKNKHIVGTEFKKIEWIQFYDLFNFIFSNEFPNLRHMYEFEKEEIYTLFKNTGYFEAKINTNRDLLFKEMFENIIRLSFFPQLSCNLLYFDKKIICSSSVSRIYENTFLSHQFLSSSPDNMEAKSMYLLFKGINEFLINNPYYKYYITYIDNDLDWNKNLFVNAAKYINNFDNFRLDTLSIYTYKIDNDYNNSLGNCKYSISKETTINDFINYCTKYLSKLECDVLAYNSEDFYLSRLKETYKIMGINITRKVYSINEGSVKIGYIVLECYPTLNIINLTDNCMIYLINSRIDFKEIIKSIILNLTDVFKELNKNTFYIILKNPELYKFESDLAINNLYGPFIDLRIIGDKISTKEYCDYFELLLENK